MLVRSSSLLLVVLLALASGCSAISDTDGPAGDPPPPGMDAGSSMMGTPCSGGGDCADGERCQNDVCVCRSGHARVGDVCVDLQDDAMNCGTVGNVCASGECRDGTCTDEGCSGGTTDCDGVCVDTGWDRNHCGDCNRRCEDNEVCTDGSCARFQYAPCESCPCDECESARCCNTGDGALCVLSDTCPRG